MTANAIATWDWNSTSDAVAGWTDQGFVLASRPQGDGDLIVSLLTRDHGRCAGLVRGGRSVKKRGWFEPGAPLAVTWSARLEAHLGRFTTAEPLGAGLAALLLDDADRLAALAAAAALLEVLLPDRQPLAAAFAGLAGFLAALPRPGWQRAYLDWEAGLAAALGYGLDLSRCAVSGSNDRLAYVSPRSGRAVSESAGEAYRDRLLPLPLVLLDRAEPLTPEALRQAFRLHGHFLALASADGGLPPARARLLERLSQPDKTEA
jgi:DNA repair protein RecO (recombination protein O)